MLTIIFYGRDGIAAKAKAKEVAPRLPSVARIYDAMSWTGAQDTCDAVVVMPDVPAWKRDMIEAAYPGKVERTDAAPAQSPAIGLSIKHRGGGRWFVMRGEVIVSGPHSKDEAQRLAG